MKVRYIPLILSLGALLSACTLPTLDNDDQSHSGSNTSQTSTSGSGSTSTSTNSGSGSGSSSSSSSTSINENRVLASISVTGGTRTFSYGATFNTTGLKVTAKYDDNSTQTVTTKATIDSTAYNKNVAGTYTINISYTEKEVTKSTSYTVTVKEEGASAAWTIMIYLCGSDLESQNSFATSDINEILSVSGQPDDVNIIIETGGSNSWHYSGASISSSKLTRWHVRNRSLVKDKELDYAYMGTQSTFESFLTWGLTEYPAEKTGVILWNHGGAMEGVCYDEKHSSSDTLKNNEVKAALKNVLGTSNKLEFIGYDACLMQVQEIAEFNSAYANYQVGSQESEAGEGWDYDTWLDDLYAKKSTETILTAIVDGFVNANGGVDATGESYMGQYYPADQCLSYLDLSKMADYKTAWENLATKLKSKISANGKSGFNTDVMGKVKYFTDYERFGTFDAQHFLEVLEEDSTYNPGSTYINAAKTALSALVKHSSSQTEGAADAHGLCFNYYCGGTDYWYSSNKNYFTSTYSSFTNWCSLANSYGGSFESSYTIDAGGSGGGGWW